MKSISDNVIAVLKEEIRKMELETVEFKEQKEEDEKLFKQQAIEAYVKCDLITFEEEKKREIIVNLNDEVGSLHTVNQENKALIKKIKEEKEVMKDRLESMVLENENLKSGSKNFANPEAQNTQNLYEELANNSEHIQFTNGFECKSCGKTFANKRALKKHRKICTQKNYLVQKIDELNKAVSKQKMYLTKSIFNVKEKEMIKRAACNCKIGCCIYPIKHNWYKTKLNEFFDALDNADNDFGNKSETGIKPKLYSCSSCNIAFMKNLDLEDHKVPIMRIN